MSERQTDKATGIAARETIEPDELHNPVPWWFAIIALVAIAWGAAYFFFQTGYPVAAGDMRTPIVEASGDAIDGAAVYAGNCASCHQANGAGLAGVFPPLDGSEWVVNAPELPIQILLHGINGEMQVNGQRYQGVMPGFAQLSDGELAAVVSYIRGSWSNAASPVSDSDVAVGRESYPDRGPWNSGSELRATIADPGQ
nr:c-type cytochrome [Oceanococcus sp. HetDA_MAG_MS8]